jgi:ubiquitin C-terminal hydrolase
LLDNIRAPHFDFSIPSSTQYRGLKNLGNTCYINSVVQQLFHFTPFSSKILKAKFKDPILKSIQKLFFFLLKSDRSYINPEFLLDACSSFPIKLKQQQDANDFLHLFLGQFPSEWTKCFFGDLINFIKGSGYTYSDQQIENFLVISLEIKQSKNLINSLHHFIQTEELTGNNQYFAESLKTKIDAKRNSKIQVAPQCLIFQLRRFDFDRQKLCKIKINNNFDFPDHFDLSICMLNQESIQYKLRGVIFHRGSADSGHYSSLVLIKGNWIFFDDDETSILDSYSIPQTQFYQAYLLFYEQQGIETISLDAIKIPPSLKSEIKKDNQDYHNTAKAFSEMTAKLFLQSNNEERLLKYFFSVFIFSVHQSLISQMKDKLFQIHDYYPIIEDFSVVGRIFFEKNVMTDAAKEVLKKLFQFNSPGNFILNGLAYMKENLASIDYLSEFISHLNFDSNYDEISELAAEVCDIVLVHPLHSGSIQIKSLCKIIRTTFVHLQRFHFLNKFFLSLQLNQHHILPKMLRSLLQLSIISLDKLKVIFSDQFHAGEWSEFFLPMINNKDNFLEILQFYEHIGLKDFSLISGLIKSFNSSYQETILIHLKELFIKYLMSEEQILRSKTVELFHKFTFGFEVILPSIVQDIQLLTFESLQIIEASLKKRPDTYSDQLIEKISDFQPQTAEEKRLCFSIKKQISKIHPDKAFPFSAKDYFEELVDSFNERNLLDFRQSFVFFANSFPSLSKEDKLEILQKNIWTEMIDFTGRLFVSTELNALNLLVLEIKKLHAFDSRLEKLIYNEKFTGRFFPLAVTFQYLPEIRQFHFEESHLRSISCTLRHFIEKNTFPDAVTGILEFLSEKSFSLSNDDTEFFQKYFVNQSKSRELMFLRKFLYNCGYHNSISLSLQSCIEKCTDNTRSHWEEYILLIDIELKNNPNSMKVVSLIQKSYDCHKTRNPVKSSFGTDLSG